MYEEDDQNITVLRKRRRNGVHSAENSPNGNGSSSNGHANGYANGNGHGANGKQSWGWTRKSNEFADGESEARQERAEIPHAEQTRRRLMFEDAGRRHQQQEATPDAAAFDV
jgi:hypothetical protein